MPKPREPGDENIRALEDLKLAADDSSAGQGEIPRRAGNPTRPAQDSKSTKSPATAQSEEPLFPEMPAQRTYAATPAPMRPPPIPSRAVERKPGPANTDSPQYHCLSCGYGLSPHNAFRCSECGRQYDSGLLSAWFEGTEETRFNYLIWLVTAALILKAWSFLAITILSFSSATFSIQSTCFDVLVLLGGAACGIAACAWAGRDRMDTLGGYYAIAGMFAGGVTGVGALFGGLKDTSTFIRPAVLFASDALCGSLFLLALLQPLHGIEFWRARSLRLIALPLAIGLPPVAMLLYAGEKAIKEAIQSAGGTIPAAMQIVNSTSLMACVSFAVWIVARHWLVGFRQMVFSRADESADVVESSE